MIDEMRNDGLDNKMKINFRTKFKDKIRFIHKTGLKETLLAERPNQDHDQSPDPEYPTPDNSYAYSLSPIKTPRRCFTLGSEHTEQTILNLHKKTHANKSSFHVGTV